MLKMIVITSHRCEAYNEKNDRPARGRSRGKWSRDIFIRVVWILVNYRAENIGQLTVLK